MALLATFPVLLYEFAEWHWLVLPWMPIATIGAAAAFVGGFKNNATYARMWEARQVWGGIVNTSRSFAISARDFADNGDGKKSSPYIHKQLIHRHIAWLTALRYQLREPRSWENLDKPYNRDTLQYYEIPELDGRLKSKLEELVGPYETNLVWEKSNRATQLLGLQSQQLRELADAGQLENFRFIALENIIAQLLNHQGKCERIKNFPYPRQFVTLNIIIVRIFELMVPFGLINEFSKLGEHRIWAAIPVSVAVMWIFHALEKVGESTENPFEGGANDIPMYQLCRTIEIDLRELLDEENIPAPITPRNNIVL